MLLERIDEIPWGSLEHAYGRAADVPDLLRALTRPEDRKGALWALYGNIFHQGTRYEATPHAIPFLVELIEAGVARAELLAYTRHLVGGYCSLTASGLWCDGQTLHLWDGAAVPADSATQALGYGQTPALLAQIWQRAAEALPTWLGLLGDPEPAVRGQAAVLLRLFAEVEGVAEALRARLAAEAEGSVRADLCFALGGVDAAAVEGCLADPDEACRFVAAVCGPPTSAALDVVVAGLSGVEGFEAVRAADGEDAPSVAGDALLRAPPEVLRAAVPALTEALGRASGFGVVPLVRALLAAAFPAPLAGEPDPLQRAVLEALVAHPYVWTIGNLWEDFERIDVPHERFGLAARLGIEVPEDDGLTEIEHGLTLAGMGFPEKAIEHFDRVGDPGLFRAHPRGGEAQLHYAQALSEIEGREEDAIRLWDEAAAGLPDPVPAWLNRSILVGRARGRQAQVEVLEALAAEWPRAEVFHHLGIALRHAERFEEALAAARQALAIEPEHRDAWWNLGAVLSLLGRTDEAIAAVERCAAIDPTEVDALWLDADFDAIREDPRFRAALGY